MQGENACTLPDVKWAIVHRLNNVKSRSLTIAELCDPDLGEAVWEKDYVPKTQTIRNYVSEVNSTFIKFGIIATLCFSEKTGAFTLQLPKNTDTEEPAHESDTEAQSALDKHPETKKTAKRKDDTQGNSPPGR